MLLKVMVVMLSMLTVGASAAEIRSTGYVVGTETPICKVRRDLPFAGKPGETARINMCRNEYEAVQVVIAAQDSPLTNVSVSVSPLKGAGGSVISVDRIKLNFVDYVETRKPKYEVDYVGWFPDPLMDMKAFDVPRETNQPIWITVHSSEKTKAGVYKGRVSIKPANAPETVIPLEVRVWDFSLPKKTHLKTAFALFESEIEAWYGKITPEMRRAYYEFLLEHRLNPGSIYTYKPQPAKEDIPFCVERGMNEINLSYMDALDEAGRANLLKMLKDYESYLKEHGWWDKAYVYGFDEVQPNRYEQVKDTYSWIKQNFPDLPRMCTVVPNEALKGYIDIWVPLTANFDLTTAEQYRKIGNEVWWYICLAPVHPYANWFVDYPATEPRLLFWMNWKYQVPGFLYYALNMWESNRSAENLPSNFQVHKDEQARESIKAGKRWPEVSWNTFTYDRYNGDGHLIYPGPDGKPISSIRMECIRDGIEDYEYFYLLNSLVERLEKSPDADRSLLAKAKSLLVVNDKVVKSVTAYTADPRVIMNERDSVAMMIEKLNAVLAVK